MQVKKYQVCQDGRLGVDIDIGQSLGHVFWLTLPSLIPPQAQQEIRSPGLQAPHDQTC